MKRGLLIAVGVAALVVVAATLALPVAEARIAAEIKSRIGQRPDLKAATVEVGILSRRIALGDVSLARPDAGTITVKRIEASGLSWPLGELLAGRTPLTGWNWGDPLDVGRVEIGEIAVSNPTEEMEWRVPSIVLEGVYLPRYQPHRQPLPDGSLAQEFLALSNLSVRRIEERGLEFRQAASPEMVRIASVVLENLKGGAIGTLRVGGLEVFDGKPAASFSLGEFVARRLDLSGSVAKMADSEWVPGMSVGRVWFEEISVDRLGGTLLADEALSIGRIVMESRRDNGNARGRTRVESFAIRPSADNPNTLATRAMLAMVNLEEIKGSFDCRGGEDRAKGELAIESCTLKFHDLMDVELALKIVDADETFWRSFDEGDLAMLMGSRAGLGTASVTLRDASLLQRLVELHGRTNGSSPREARAVLAREVRRFQPTDVLITEDMTKLADTVAKFVENGGAITLTAKPEPPLTVDGSRVLWAPGPDLVSVLGLTATLSK